MADTITIAGKAIPKSGLYVGGAIAIGVLGVLYWKHNQGGGSSTSADTGSTDSGLGYEDYGSSGLNYSGVPLFDPATGATISSYGYVSQVNTNAQWAQAAQAYLAGQNYDPHVVAAAIGKVLTGQPVTDEEAAIWAAARGFEGEPPQGYPPLVHAPGSGQSGSKTTLKAPANVHVDSRSKSSIKFGWNAVSGAKSYHTYINGQVYKSTTSTNIVVSGLHANTHYTLQVRGIDVNGNLGPSGSVSTSTTK